MNHNRVFVNPDEIGGSSLTLGKNMRATWYSSLLSGFGMGTLAALSNPNYEFPWGIVLLIVFFPAMIFGVMGWPQIREVHAQQRKRRADFFTMQLQPGDLRQYLLPTWGRMLVCFLSTAATAFILPGFFE